MIKVGRKRGRYKKPIKTERKTNGCVVRNSEAEGDDSGTSLI